MAYIFYEASITYSLKNSAIPEFLWHTLLLIIMGGSTNEKEIEKVLDLLREA